MVTSVSAYIGSKFTMSAARRKVAVPPYCGLPSLSHQLPAALVVVVVGLVVDTADVVVGRIDVVVLATVDTVVRVEVVVEEEQEARTNDDTIKQVETIQMAPFFTF